MRYREGRDGPIGLAKARHCYVIHNWSVGNAVNEGSTLLKIGSLL